MIISKIISGLGNQLFQYAIGKQLALKNDVELKLDISFFENQNLRSYKLYPFNIDAEVIKPNELADFLIPYTKTTVPYKIYRKFEQLLPRSKRIIFQEQHDWLFDNNLSKVSSDTYIIGYWQNHKYFENLNSEIFEELTIKPIYLEDIKNYINLIQSDRNSVSVHIRRGDYITDKEAYNLMGVMPISYYKQAIDFIRTKKKDATFYFFSDDLDWVKRNFKDSKFQFIDGKTDYADLHLMHNCKHNIIANSSFSWWGAFLNRNPEKIVIAPKQWVKPDDINKNIEIVFPSWIKI